MKEKELKLDIEELEERIAPSFVFAGGSAPADTGADPTGGQGGLTGSFGPNSGDHPTKDPWVVHESRDSNSGVAFEHTPLDNGDNV